MLIDALFSFSGRTFVFVLSTFKYCLGQSVAASILVLRHILFFIDIPNFCLQRRQDNQPHPVRPIQTLLDRI